LLHRLQLTRKKMIGAGEEHQSFGFGGGGGHLHQLCCWRELVVVSTEKELWNFAVAQERIAIFAVVNLDGESKGGKCADIGACFSGAATSRKRHRRAKAEADHHQRAFVFIFKPVESGQHIPSLSLAVVRSLAQTRPAKVEAQHRPAQTKVWIVESFHGVVDNLVVQ